MEPHSGIILKVNPALPDAYDHPSISEINKASIENEIIYEVSILKHDSVSVFGEILPVLY